MNNFVGNFLNANECINSQEEENFKNYEFIATSNKIVVPSKNDILDSFNLISYRDKISFSIRTEYGSKIYLSNEGNIDTFICELNELITNKDDDEKYYLNLTITKILSNNILSIYNLKSYQNFLINQKLEYLNILSNYLMENECIIFECQEQIKEFYTSTLYFINKKTDIYKYKIDNKNKFEILNKRNDICSFLNAAQLSFIPEDFNFIEYSESSELRDFFDKLKVVISISYICNITSFDYVANLVSYKINGYKTIMNNVTFENVKSSFADEIYKIYEWTYNGGNLSDKIGLSRNVITLHVNNNDIFTLEENTLESIKSSYEIYLKDNVTQYLQLKANINQSLNEYLLKTEQIIDNFINIFYKYLIGIVTFIISVIVMNCIYAGKGNLINVITGDIGIIAVGLLLSSIIGIKFIIEPEIKKKFDRYEFQYRKLKSGYSKLLNKEDLNEIFDDDIYLKKNRNDIEQSIKKYSKVWNIIILVLISSVIIA